METFEKQRLAFQNLYHVTEIPFFILSTTGTTIASFPEGAQNFYQTDYWQNTSLGNIKGKPSNEPTLFEVGDFCYVAIMKLDSNLFLTTVPVRSTTQFSHNLFPALMRGIHPEKQLEFYRFLLDVPIKTNYQLAEFASLCKMIYCHEPATGFNIQTLAPHKNAFLPEEIEYRLAVEDTHAAKHAALDFESNILSAIKSGDEASLQHALNRSLHGNIGRMSSNALHQAQYEFICMVYASCRAAISGGLPEEYAFTLSDSMCQKMDTLHDVEEIRKYSRKCMFEYCHQTHNNSKTNLYSSYTKACCDYITEHLFEPITIDALSNKIGLNRKSLSKYFKKDTGKSIPEYILSKRLSEATYLLANSEMSISSISELLQFSSQSHFTERFREHYSFTPLQYRLNHDRTKKLPT